MLGRTRTLAVAQPVDFTGAKLSGNTLTIDLPSRSVVALELQ